jgi:hypothetical protein
MVQSSQIRRKGELENINDQVSEEVVEDVVELQLVVVEITIHGVHESVAFDNRFVTTMEEDHT